MEIIATQKFVHTAPRKLRLVADMVRKMSPLQALTVLQFTPKAAGMDLSNAIKTALGNAKQKNLDSERLIFKSLEVNEGPKMRRMRVGSKGRSNPYKRRMSHIKIVLSDDSRIQDTGDSEQSEQKTKKSTKKLKKGGSV